MKVLFATAELAPLVRVGGLAEAASGLVRSLREAAVDVEVVLPDYFDTNLIDEDRTVVVGPEWVGPVVARRGVLPGFGIVTLLGFDGVARPHPYVEPSTGQGWADNDQRFFRFSAALAKLAELRQVELVHLNDWHTSAALAFLSERMPTVLSLHNLAYQGMASGQWLAQIAEDSPRSEKDQSAYECFGAINPLGGAISLADRVVAVSPNYAREILQPENGFGLDLLLRERGPELIGILNGIDAAEWDPSEDPFLPSTFTLSGLGGKAECRTALVKEFGLKEKDGPVLGMVTRLVDQKGVDLLLDAAQYLSSWDANLVVLGAGDPSLAGALHQRSANVDSGIAFREGYDLGLAHRIFAGSDLYVMPSRFEPCGLAQMQAMAYGTIPVTTSVGGLLDTVIDADIDPVNGNGFRSPHNSGAGLVDALHRATKAWNVPARRHRIVANGMGRDWSWVEPAHRYANLYRELIASRT
jgi:starch synthase